MLKLYKKPYDVSGNIRYQSWVYFGGRHAVNKQPSISVVTIQLFILYLRVWRKVVGYLYLFTLYTKHLPKLVDSVANWKVLMQQRYIIKNVIILLLVVHFGF